MKKKRQRGNQRKSATGACISYCWQLLLKQNKLEEVGRGQLESHRGKMKQKP